MHNESFSEFSIKVVASTLLGETEKLPVSVGDQGT